MKEFDAWNFDVLMLNDLTGGDSLNHVMLKTFQEHRLLDFCKLHADTLRLFCEKIKEEYASASANDESTTATFHRPYHAAHMVHAVHSILVNTCLEQFLDETEKLSLVLAAATFHLGHPGTDNSFQARFFTDACATYGPDAILEKMHTSKATDLLVGRSNSEGVLSSLLCNDHWRCVVQVRHLVRWGGQVRQSSKNRRISKVRKIDILHDTIHFASVCHRTKAFPLAQRWTSLLFAERFLQGDVEMAVDSAKASIYASRDNKIVARQESWELSIHGSTQDSWISFITEITRLHGLTTVRKTWWQLRWQQLRTAVLGAWSSLWPRDHHPEAIEEHEEGESEGGRGGSLTAPLESYPRSNSGKLVFNIVCDYAKKRFLGVTFRQSSGVSQQRDEVKSLAALKRFRCSVGDHVQENYNSWMRIMNARIAREQEDYDVEEEPLKHSESGRSDELPVAPPRRRRHYMEKA